MVWKRNADMRASPRLSRANRYPRFLQSPPVDAGAVLRGSLPWPATARRAFIFAAVARFAPLPASTRVGGPRVAARSSAGLRRVPELGRPGARRGDGAGAAGAGRARRPRLAGAPHPAGVLRAADRAVPDPARRAGRGR